LQGELKRADKLAVGTRLAVNRLEEKIEAVHTNIADVKNTQNIIHKFILNNNK